MNKRRIGTKSVYCSTEEGVNTQNQIEYNPRTDHIMFGSASFRKSPGWSDGSANNKNCATYLGITVAELVLSKAFNHVKRMPNNNPGFDFKCNHGYLIDVKSATKTKTRNAWMFRIKRNHIADHFLCLAFDNRQQLNPLHIWLIPGEKVNHLVGLWISVSTIDKWSKYELSDKLDKVIACCNVLKEA